MDGATTLRRETDGGLAIKARAPTRLAGNGEAAAHMPRVLLVDDDRALAENCAKVLDGTGYRVTLCRYHEEARALIERCTFDIVLLELPLSDGAGMEFLRELQERSPSAIVIATSAEASVPASIAACENGAWDYLPKPFSATQLEIVVGRAAHELRVSRVSVDAIAENDGRTAPDCECTVLGASPAIREVIRLARRVAATDASVFITGESGTGKERIAHFIHRQSCRRNRPLVAINCAAIPETLLETEMFGHRKGAFTGAVEEKQGLLEVADGGTFFLDELLQMPLATQAKLLRVVQDGVVRRVGSGSVNAVVNVRFIAATNRSAEVAIRDGRLREDLYYRLRVFPIHLPPLRERREDIPPLAEHFLQLFWQRHRRGSLTPRFSASGMQALADHPWRGNIRELQNVIEHGVVLFEPGMVIEPVDIPFAPEVEQPGELPTSVDGLLPGDVLELGFYETRERLLAQFERRYMTSLMSHTDGNLSKAARIAGVQRTTLYRLMEKHGLQRQISVVAGGEGSIDGAPMRAD